MRGYTVVTDDVMALVQRQRRVALTLLACILVPLLVFSLVVGRIDALSTWQPLGLLTLPWLILGPGVLFSIVAIAYVHERIALRIENEWSDEHADAPGADRISAPGPTEATASPDDDGDER